MKNNDFLGTESVGRLLFKLSAPTIVSQIINLLYNMVDRIYIGHMGKDSSLALAGIGVCVPVIMIVTAFAALAASGGVPKMSMALGKKNISLAERIMGNSFTMLTLFSVTLTVVVLIFRRPMLLLFGASENTIDYAVSYMGVYAVGTIFVLFAVGMNAFITAQGFSKISLVFVSVGAVCNIALDPVFIFVLHMGVKGAAVATVISQAVSAVLVIRFLTGEKTIVRLRKKCIRIERKMAGGIILLGTAPFVMQASECAVSVCFNSSLQKYGGDIAVGAMSIVVTVMQFSFLPLQGLGQGAQPIISFNYGGKDAGRVKRTIKFFITSSLVYSMAMWSVVMIFPEIFAGIFTANAELVSFTARVLRIYCAAMGVFGFQISCQFVFSALGKAKASISVAVMRKFVLLIPLIYIMPRFFAEKAIGVYYAELVADFISVVFTAVLFFPVFRNIEKECKK